MKRGLLALLLLPSILWAPPNSSNPSGSNPPLKVQEEDGSPVGYPRTLKFSNGSVTNNGDGSYSITTSSGGGGGGSGTPAGSNGNVQYNNGGSFGGANFFNIYASSSTTTADMVYKTASIGPVLTDSNNCTWRTTVTTAGSLVTSLIECPPVVASGPRTCSRGQSLGLLLSITCSETLR